ncbi:MAG TPA: 1-deoxy-D-xylulose-5-phosphate reductoisomerase [Bryobacteraceae bacterium]|nr:1-deoxy-D-xylulose-5-phosphate reductoisomerase [Bryobacteraceae bacterium]
MTLTILGSTGSIGTNALDVVRQHGDRFHIHALVAGKNVDLLCSQILEFRPRLAVMDNPASIDALRLRLLESGFVRQNWPELACDPAVRIEASTASEVDFVMSAIVGVAGLPATYAAIQSKKRVGLANKEVLVSSGRLVMDAVRMSGAELIPVDSEHNGAHQCFRAGRRSEVTRLLLTASGGPFRETAPELLKSVTPEQALNHPTWKMGRRITIDSATLMNKGFEVIEACWLFDLAPSQVDVVVHPQSSIHAMVEFNDGSIIAQVSATDMRMPIQYAMTYPDRDRAPVPRIDWTQPRTWQFSAPDFAKFPLLRLAYQSLESGGSASCTLNAADEIAVEAFLDHRIGFTEIAEVVEETLARKPGREATTIEEIIEIDLASRQAAREIVAGKLRRA